MVLRKHKPKIIAITGSVGKTSTKDAVYAVISSAFETRKSEKSMNGDIGLPLAILGLENAWSSASGWLHNIFLGARIVFSKGFFPDWLVLEVGADHPKDIEKISRWLHPDIVVLTRMSETPVHVEFFKDAQEVLREKMFLTRALRSNGTLVINADDHLFANAVRDLPTRKLFYGREKNADVKIVETGISYNATLPTGHYVVIDINNQRQKIEIEGVIGSHIMHSIAAASAVALSLGITDDLQNIFKRMDPPKGRMRLLAGKSGSLIIDDTYNSSPIACEEALKALREARVTGRKIAVLGDMKELGKHSQKAHREIGKLAAEIVHTLITVGEMTKDMAEAAEKSGLSSDRILSLSTSSEAVKKLSDFVRAGDIILIKGSQSMRMERIVKALLDDSSNADNLLVRQEKEWRER